MLERNENELEGGNIAQLTWTPIIFRDAHHFMVRLTHCPDLPILLSNHIMKSSKCDPLTEYFTTSLQEPAVGTPVLYLMLCAMVMEIVIQNSQGSVNGI